MQFGVPPLTRGVKWLGATTLAVSVLAAVLGESGAALVHSVVFLPADFFRGFVWTPLTYTFLNPDPISLLFALLGLWLLGAMLEPTWGTRRFVIFYFLTGAAGALLTALVGLIWLPVRGTLYYGNWSSLEGLIAAIAVLMPAAQIFLYFLPIQAKWMLPVSAGITVLYMLMRPPWWAYLPQLFGLGAGVVFAGGVAPRGLLLKVRLWWLDRRMRRGKLRVIKGDDDTHFGSGSGSGSGRGSDKYLH